MSFRPTLTELNADGIDLLTDERAAERGVNVFFTDRHGGVSAAPFDSLNLSMRVGDDVSRVAENRRRVAGATGFDVDRLSLARQVHGADVIEVRDGAEGVVGEADVLFTRSPAMTIGVLTADCTPVVLWGDGVVGLVHAGWRGLVAGAVETGVATLGEVSAAWVGPSIHACCYEVGPEVIDSFTQSGLPVADHAHVDPGHAAVVALRRAGVEAIFASDACTSCDRRYFSYRRDGVTGRQGAFVTLG
jgi:YfiH family protein